MEPLHDCGYCLILAFILFSFAAHAQSPIQEEVAPKDFVSEVLPYSIDEVRARALLLFDSDKRDYYDDYNARIYELPEPVASYKDLSPKAYKRFMALPLVRPNKFYVFFGAYPNMQSVLAALSPINAIGHNNAGLQRYVQLPASARAQDIYVWSPDTPYWHSEYKRNGHPLPFKSYFIVHLSAVDADHTQVEIIENDPVVRLSGGMTVDVHGIVRDYEVREVDPTTKDREFLLSCIRQFIERRVPGRHWFNCRDKGEVVEEPIPFTVP